MDELARVELEQRAEELAPARLAGGQLHHPHPEDDHGWRVMHHHLGAFRRANQPQVRLDLFGGRRAALKAIEPTLYVFAGDHASLLPGSRSACSLCASKRSAKSNRSSTSANRPFTASNSSRTPGSNGALPRNRSTNAYPSGPRRSFTATTAAMIVRITNRSGLMTASTTFLAPQPVRLPLLGQQPLGEVHPLFQLGHLAADLVQRVEQGLVVARF